jgi:DNA-binding beta-propeller fold protein YncE
MHFLNRAVAVAVTAVAVLATPAMAQRAFWEFESGQVRPLALSSDGTKLYAVNTPRNTLEILSVGAGGLTLQQSIPVGLEPVAVAVRPNSTQVWVVNHLSDSVSIVETASTPARVIRTLLVGDEPRDIAFAGTSFNRAFITTAHRGQNIGFDPQLTTAGVGRSDVWVFDATNLGASVGGTPVAVLKLFGDTPRPLAVSPNGQTVYAGVFQSGNQTTTINEGVVCNGGASAGSCSVGGVTYPGGLPAPNADLAGERAPETGMIVRWNGSHWVDTIGRNWDAAVRFSLPDNDVFAINATANPPTQASAYQHVGTVLFNMAVNPVSGKLYVSNTDARNEVRFEGPGGGGTTVQGHLAESRITVISGSTVTPRHLNKHINYGIRPAPAGTAGKSLATPMGIAVSSNGATLYVAAFGSSKVGIFNTAALENNTFTPDPSTHIVVSGGGPSGLALDEPRNRLYVMTRFDDSISVVDLATKAELQHLALANPEPAGITTGRRFLYDALATSTNGEASCSSCHIFGDFDSLAWDLGNPDDVLKANPIPINLGQFATLGLGTIVAQKNFHPMKGPMTTQSLRGLAHHGAMHWRGDRSVGVFGTDPTDENLSFNNFIVAFEGLVGGTPGQVSNAQMQQFTDFQLQVVYPPNPIRNLDNSLNSTQSAGRNFFLGNVGLIRPHRSDGLAFDITSGPDGFTCEGCHELDRPEGEFGTSTHTSFENEPQVIKVAHLRNLYQKVGMFGSPQVNEVLAGDNGNKGAQIRGFGFLHDGSIDTVFRFLRANVFAGIFPSTGTGFDPLVGDIQRRQVEQFVLAFDSTLAPIVGQQITLTNTNGSTVGSRISLLIARARTSFTMVEDPTAHECDLVVKGNVAGQQRSWLLNASTGTFTPDNGGAALTDSQLRAIANTAGQELTYTCVPPGSGSRIAFQL